MCCCQESESILSGTASSFPLRPFETILWPENGRGPRSFYQIRSAGWRSAGGLHSSFRAPRGLLLPCLSPFFEQDKAGRQRDIFQLPLTLFIITNMKGRERDWVYRTGSLWSLIYLSQAAVGWASFLFVSDVGNWNMNLCWWENKGIERGINLIFSQP